MNPKVSVIVPAYDGGELLCEAVESVLGQTYSNIELLVVDDCSSDGSVELLRRYSDPRFTLIRHTTNLGPDHARKTGLLASSGEVVAFLDQDDLFHPEKIAGHVACLRDNPDAGFTFNSFLMCSGSRAATLSISRPKDRIELRDILLGFPLPPSVWVMRREWATLPELWDEDTFMCGSEVIVCGRLILAGCRMARVDRVLNYRRLHPERRMRDIAGLAQQELKCQDILLADHRCPPELRNWRNPARANTFMEFAFVAFEQGATDLAWGLMREAARVRADLHAENSASLVQFLLLRSARNWNREPEPALMAAFRTTPDEFHLSKDDLGLVIEQAGILRASRAAMWGCTDLAREIMRRARRKPAGISEIVADTLCQELAQYEHEYGASSADAAMKQVFDLLASFAGPYNAKRLRARRYFTRVFRFHEVGNRAEVIHNYMRACLDDPSYLANRGGLSLVSQALGGYFMRDNRSTVANI